jgi:ribosomal protein S18 acetylase RimI-like enzyme
MSETNRYILRQSTEADRAFLWSLQATAMRPHVEKIWGWDEAQQRAMFAERWDPAPRQIIVVDGREIGVVEVERRVDELYIDTLQIAVDAQNRGVGGAVLRDLIAEAHARGRPATLQTFIINPARRLYERLGFEVVGQNATHVQMRCDPPTCD